MKISKIKVPIIDYREQGGARGLLEYHQTYPGDARKIEWVDNEAFEAHMSFTGISRGRSSLRMDLQDNRTAIGYGLFAQSMPEVIQAMVYGEVHGRWQVRKHGANYGLVYLGPAEEG